MRIELPLRCEKEGNDDKDEDAEIRELSGGWG